MGVSSAQDVRDVVRRFEGGGMRTFSEPEPLVWSRTAGAHVWDEEGTDYLDLYAGFAVATVGYCHPRVTEAIARQASTMTHCPSAHPSRARAELYERIAAIAPNGLDRTLRAVTGSLANELAVQLARAATGRHTVVSFSGSYFGRSVGSVGLAGKSAYRAPLRVDADAQFVPFPDPYRSPWPSEAGEGVLALLEELLFDPASGVDPPAAIVVEPVQGNGGVVVPPDGFLRGLRSLAHRAGALLVFDEIQCGFGRTGRTWACDHWGVVPDLMTIGKGVGGGLPFAAVLGTAEVMQTWQADATTSTFLTNALVDVAATAAIDVLIEERLVDRSARLGELTLARLRSELAEADPVGDVRGLGLFVGVELVADRETRVPDPARAAAAQAELQSRRILVGRGGRHGNVIKLSPPLVVDEDELAAALDQLVEVLN